MAFVAGAFATIGSLMQSGEDAAALRGEAEVEGYHAQASRIAATARGQQASAAEEALRRQQRQEQGRMRAAIAESGTGFAGSNEDIQRQSLAIDELDALNIQWEGNTERLNLLEQAKMHDYNKGLLNKRAKNIMRMRWLNAGLSGMSAYGGAGGSFSYFGSQKGPG